MTGDELQRRHYLSAMAAATAIGFAGCGGGGDGDRTDRQTQTPNETTGEPTETQPQQQSGSTIDPEQVQASADGRVVPVADGLGLEDAIDPAESETPIQDAVDAIGTDEFFGSGAVLLPPTRIKEPGPVLRTRHKSFIGWGTRSSIIEFTDPHSPGVAQDYDVQRDLSLTYWDGITFIGGDPGTRTAPAFKLGRAGRETSEPQAVNGFNLGKVEFLSWGDPVIHFDGISLFESHWEWVQMIAGIHGRMLLVENNDFAGTGLVCNNLDFIREGPGRLVHVVNGGGSFTVQNLHVAHESTANTTQNVPVVDIEYVDSKPFHVGQLHHETGAPGRGTDIVGHEIPSVLRFEGTGKVRVDDVNTLRGTYDTIVDLHETNQARVGRIDWDASELTGTELTITGPPPQGWSQRGNIIYEGPSNHVTDETGSRLGHVYALGDQRVVDPLFRGQVLHTTGSETAVSVSGQAAGGTLADRERRKITPTLRILEPTTMPDEPFAVDHYFAWDPDSEDGVWTLVLEWKRDPGIDVEFDVEVTARSADGHGLTLGGRDS